MKLMTFERFEPYAVKIARPVLRRGRRSNPSSLSDSAQIERRAGRAPRTPNIRRNTIVNNNGEKEKKNEKSMYVFKFSNFYIVNFL